MLEFIGKYWAPIYALISTLFCAVVWAMGKKYATQEHVDKLERRVAKAEGDIDKLPTDEEIHQLEMKIVKIGAKMDGLSGQLSKFEYMVKLLLENELQQGDKK